MKIIAYLGIAVAEHTYTVAIPEMNPTNRARRACPSTWRRNKRATAVTQGIIHVNHKKQVIPPKRRLYVNCACRYRCNQCIDEQHQAMLFQEYRDLPDRIQQRAYLASLIVEECVKNRTVAEPKIARTLSAAYHLLDHNRELVRVCRAFFCATFGISSTITKNIIKKKSPTSGIYRGEHKGVGKEPWNKTPRRALSAVKRFINSIPKMPSHYCRKESKKLYFEPTLNLRRLYELYKSKEDIEDPVSYYVFSHIFQEWDPPLGFYKPRKDQCTLCNTHDTKEGWPDNEEFENHVLRKDIISLNKDEDKKAAILEKENKLYATFDLEAILSLPYCEDAMLYYSRKLSFFNFTILDSNLNGLCNAWDETNGRKGCCEIGSCILKYLKERVGPNIKHIVFYADTCAGQNRNQFLIAALLLAVNCDEWSHADVIDLKYLESGHSHMECDSMHAAIERARERKKVYSPNEYAIIFELARRTPRPYVVNHLSHSDFYDLRDVADKILFNRTRDENGHSVSWLTIKWFRFVRGEFKVYFKYDVEEEKFECLNVLDHHKKKLNRDLLLPLKLAYPGRLPISVVKKRDLLELLKKGVIPPVYENFYTSLPTSKTEKDAAYWVEEDGMEEYEVEELGLDECI